MSSQTGTPAPWPAGTEVPVVLGANVFSADPDNKSLQHAILMYNFKPGHVDYGRDAEVLQKPNGEVVIRHPLKVAGKEGKDEDEDETDDDDLLAEGAMMAQGEKHGKAPEMLTFNGHTAKAYDKEFVLIYGPDGTFKLERVTQYFTYLKEARSMSGGLLGSMPPPSVSAGSTQGRAAAPQDAERKVAALMRQGAKKTLANKDKEAKAEAKKKEREEMAEAKKREREEKAEAKKKERDEKAEAKRREKEEKAEAKRKEREEAGGKGKGKGARKGSRNGEAMGQAEEETEDEYIKAEAKEETRTSVTGKRVRRERDEDEGVSVPTEWMDTEAGEETELIDGGGGGGTDEGDGEDEIVVKKQKT